eukprot:gene19583-biopygen6175
MKHQDTDSSLSFIALSSIMMAPVCILHSGLCLVCLGVETKGFTWCFTVGDRTARERCPIAYSEAPRFKAPEVFGAPVPLLVLSPTPSAEVCPLLFHMHCGHMSRAHARMRLTRLPPRRSGKRGRGRVEHHSSCCLW